MTNEHPLKKDNAPPKKRNWLFPVKPENSSWSRWILLRLMMILGLTAATAIGIGLAFKNELIFHPRAEAESTPDNYGLEYQEVWLRTADGLRVKAWELPAKSSDRRAAALVFQGNGGNMSYLMPQLRALRSLGLTVMTVDYPGYGESEGHPTVDNAYQTAEALWRHAVSRGFEPEDIIIYGFSLGGGVASYLAEKHSPAALVLDSTFTRLRDVPSEHMPLFKPYLKLVLGDLLDTQKRLADIRVPLLVIHRPEDTVVPYDLGRELFDGYRGRYKDMVAGHGDHMDFLLNEDLYLGALKRLLDAALPVTEK